MLYHYSASFSDYEIDNTLFGGFIAALASFTETLSDAVFEFLKMQDDELHFIVDDNIIVVSIMSTADAEQQVINQLLTFVGEKFNENYAKYLMVDNFDWEKVEKEFTSEIEFIASDEEIYEEMKRELIQKLFNEVIQGILPPDILNWKVAHLFSTSTRSEIHKTIEMIDRLDNILPTMKHDKILESKIKDAFLTAKHQLNTKFQEKNQLLVLCHNDIIFQKILKNFLAYSTLCVKITEFSGLIAAIQSIENWIDNIAYNVLIIDPHLSLDEIEQLLQLQIAGKIFIWTRQKLSPEYSEIFDPYENITLHNGYCDFDYGCPKIFNIVNEIGFNSKYQLIDQQLKIIVE
jgi:hypothetical protein